MNDTTSLLGKLRRLIKEKSLLSGKDLISIGITKSSSTLSRWRQRGEGPPCLKLSKGKYLYSTQALIDWLDACTISSKTSLAAQQSQSTPYTFLNRSHRQHYQHIKQAIPDRPTPQDLVNSGYWNPVQLLQDIKNQAGLVFTCSGDDAAYSASMDFEHPLPSAEYMKDPEQPEECVTDQNV